MLEVKVTLELSENFENLLSKLMGTATPAPVQTEPGNWEVGGCAAVEEPKFVENEEKEIIKEEPKKIETSSVETTEIAYTFTQLQTCAAKIARNGKRDELSKILNDLGISTLMDLKPNQYNNFALKLRELGGTI